MATVTSTESSIAIEQDQVVELRDIGWNGYSTVLRLRGEKSSPQMIYLDGDLLLVSPSFTHEWLKERFGTFIAEVVVGLDIPCVLAGSTTYRRRKKKGGFEPDQSYYLANYTRIKGKKNIHLKVDPPPDLAIEVVFSHDADRALEVCRRLMMPEVWVSDEGGLRLLVLGDSGSYEETAISPSFATLSAVEIFEWVTRDRDAHDTDWIKAVRTWVRETLVPRVTKGGEPNG